MKEGYYIRFFTQQNREHEGKPLAQWIIDEAKKLGIGGATLFTAREGFGHDGRYHSDGYFDMEDPPQQIAIALLPEEYESLVTLMKDHGLRVFHTKSKIEFGFTSE